MYRGEFTLQVTKVGTVTRTRHTYHNLLAGILVTLPEGDYVIPVSNPIAAQLIMNMGMGGMG